jgi:hypothetical protein
MRGAVDDPLHDPLALWRGIDDAVGREAVRRRKMPAPVKAASPPPRLPARGPTVPARTMEPA